MTTLYPFSAMRIDGTPFSMEALRGQVVLIVNTASACGYTGQYAGLQALHERFHVHGLEILAFPCNQFGNQEPHGNAEVADFCTRRFGVTFGLFAKTDVNGDQALPLWRWLTGAEGSRPQPVKWNFTKFLIDRKGRLVRRYEPSLTPAEIEDDLRSVLGLEKASLRGER
ncbi:glutathione peroxidase [Gulbenkiania mobilis]|uniref:Glutathione peroxidase n=1 Tax=Gulbenkiania mobilis TaxID=397457 RepID=A0ABY2CY58_GULMO|nr:glutathione peroxidase [Gulbenkiania mobilis]TCW32396.1 glutathione peroxidase [Gulbenkiania mobilis]